MKVTLGYVNLITLLFLPMIPLSRLSDSCAVYPLWTIMVLWFAYHSDNGVTFAVACWVSFLILFFAII